MGDVFADVGALSGLAAATGTGSVGEWFSTRLDEFQRIPQDVQTLRAQLARVRTVLLNARQDTGVLVVAEENLNSLVSILPQAQDKVAVALTELAPILPQLRAGSMTPAVVSSLLSNAGILVAAFSAVNNAIALRDSVRQQITQAATNPSLPSSVIDHAVAALQSVESGAWIKIGLLLAGAYIVFRTLRRVL